MAEMESSRKKRCLTRKVLKCWPFRDMGFLNISRIFVLCVEGNRRHSYCSESRVRLESATVEGAGRDSVLKACVPLS